MKYRPIYPLLAILTFAIASPAFADVLLLHSDHTIEGDLSKVEEVYHVKTGTGEIRIAANRVERVFDKFEDVYRWKRTLIRVGCHSDHIKLAKWCLKYNLLDLAQRELVDAELAEPDTPMVAYLQRRLTAKRNLKAESPPKPFTPSPGVKPIPGTPALAQPEESISLETLDRTTASISPQSMAQFSGTIQPILLNNCTTGGCHVGTGSEKVRLYRSGLSGKAGRRTTQRNLHATLKWLNPEQPDYSPLLTVPLHPHGGEARPMVERHREEYQRLVYWVFQVCREQKRSLANSFSQFDREVKPAVHTEARNPGITSKSVDSNKSILQKTLDQIPPEGANLQTKDKNGRLLPIYPSNNVTSSSPFQKALAINPGLVKSFIEKEKKSGE